MSIRLFDLEKSLLIIVNSCSHTNRGHEVAVIYGSLPPNTKLAQASKFNDPNHPCKIMVATDAIGMGLNLYVKNHIQTDEKN